MRSQQEYAEEKEKIMSLSPQQLPAIPEETARVARSLHPKGNRYMWLRDQ